MLNAKKLYKLMQDTLELYAECGAGTGYNKVSSFIYYL